MAGDCNCGVERVPDTVKCPDCGTDVSVDKCPECGAKSRSTYPSECDCWANY